MIAPLRPTRHELVYNLVKEAGIDVSDWSNSARPEEPQSNPKYCYNWSFRSHDVVVLCLWFDDMEPYDGGIIQNLNYGIKPATEKGLSGAQKNRCWQMDKAFQKAHREQLPIRVIIVDGIDRLEEKRIVANRSLDPVEWHVGSYDEDTHDCCLRRGPRPTTPDSPGTLYSVSTASTGDTFNDLYDPELLGRDKAIKQLLTVPGVARDPKVRKIVLEDSNRICERPGCGASRNFPGFIDVHHIFGVENSDRPWTCVALCPNCHREAHFSPDHASLNQELLSIARKRQPKTASNNIPLT